MTEWRKYYFKDIFQIIDGDRGVNYPKQSDLYSEGFCLFLNTGNVTSSGFNFEKNQFITKEKDKMLRKGKLRRGDIVFTTRGTVGNVALYDDSIPYENIRINSGMVILRTNESVANKEFIFQILKSNYKKKLISPFISGSVQPQLPIKDLKEISLPLPPLPEQKAIAEVLSSLDDKIDLLTRQNNTLEDLGQAFFRKWFVEDADEKLKKYPLSELMVIQNGFAFRSRDYQDAGKYKIVTIKNVQDGFIDTSGTTFLNQLPVGMPDYVLLTIGDVLISLTGNVGRVGIVVEDNLLLNQRVAKISPYNPEYLPFLYFYFRNETTREYLINLAHGTAQANLSPIETLKTEVSFSKTLIKKYSELFMPMYQKIIKNKQQIIVLQKLRDTLLPKLISGEIRLKM